MGWCRGEGRPAALALSAAAPAAGGLPVGAATALAPRGLLGVVRAIIDHVPGFTRQPHIEPVLLQVALDVVDGQALHRHQLQDALWCGLVRALQRGHC